MQLLKINRFKSGCDWTIGEFSLIDHNGYPIFNGFTLEPAGADSVIPNMDLRIPQGEYSAIFDFSPSFNMMLPLVFNENVSKSRRILIHAGNQGKNTAGCILVGNEWADNYVFKSKATLNTLLSKLDRNGFSISITNTKGAI